MVKKRGEELLDFLGYTNYGEFYGYVSAQPKTCVGRKADTSCPHGELTTPVAQQAIFQL